MKVVISSKHPVTISSCEIEGANGDFIRIKHKKPRSKKYLVSVLNRHDVVSYMPGDQGEFNGEVVVNRRQDILTIEGGIKTNEFNNLVVVDENEYETTLMNLDGLDVTMVSEDDDGGAAKKTKKKASKKKTRGKKNPIDEALDIEEEDDEDEDWESDDEEEEEDDEDWESDDEEEEEDEDDDDWGDEEDDDDDWDDEEEEEEEEVKPKRRPGRPKGSKNKVSKKKVAKKKVSKKKKRKSRWG